MLTTAATTCTQWRVDVEHSSYLSVEQLSVLVRGHRGGVVELRLQDVTAECRGVHPTYGSEAVRRYDRRCGWYAQVALARDQVMV